MNESAKKRKRKQSLNTPFLLFYVHCLPHLHMLQYLSISMDKATFFHRELHNQSQRQISQKLKSVSHTTEEKTRFHTTLMQQ